MHALMRNPDFSYSTPHQDSQNTSRLIHIIDRPVDLALTVRKKQPNTPMKRHPNPSPNPSDPPKLEITSLIDICFLLLIYFLATSTLIPNESDLRMRLPGPMPNSDFHTSIRPLFIGVHPDGAIYTGIGSCINTLDHPASGRSLPLLESHLHLYANASRAANQEPLVQIHIDPDASQQRVIDVLNSFAKYNIQSVTFTDLIEM